MSDIDDKLASAWRTASREEPPAALDAALRAAARRAVHAGPARTRHMQSWPLAAAALVAVLAIGLLQLTPPEEVTPSSIVADSTMRQLSAKKTETAPPATPTETQPAPAPPAAVATPPPQATPAPAEVARRAPPSASTSELASSSRQVAQASPAVDRFSEKQNAATQADPGTAKLRARTDTKADQESKETAARDAREPVGASPASRAEPFPAASGGKSLAAADTATAARAQAGAMSEATVPPPAASATAAANEPAKPQAAPANAMRGEATPARAPTPMAMAKTAASPERAKDKDATIKPPEEWIKLIRRLKSEGRNDEATKELAAFRAAYKERTDSLLPADLREARP